MRSTHASGTAGRPPANFAVAMTIPRLAARLHSAMLLLAGVALTLAGMAWLSRLDPGVGYLGSVALPMLLIGAGQGLASWEPGASVLRDWLLRLLESRGRRSPR
ncbi:hypothetical protein [Saccharopolyspora elongata]|uniref:Uncharacterized protein n=1 Tax=Saccharopolyspora elongata TaxID=2530387 RepID=A0A4R4YHD7_9PSEU|nr:hypothetical protein [Saccharopolyspora elongata]TDD44213.1 hypothetical protein E1288_24065 [Saccharopolyspora elongata]